MAVLERSLDQVEVQLMHYPTALLVRYRGALDEAALKRAYDALAMRNPLLRASIQRDETAYRFLVRPQDSARVAVHSGDDASYLREVAALWDTTRAVAQLTIIRGSGEGFVAMHTDHAMADGRAKYGLMTQLWKLYADIVRGVDVPVVHSTTLPLSPARVLAARLGKPEPSLPDLTKQLESVLLGQKYVSLSEEDTAQLVRTARARGTSVHALIAGTAMVIQRGYLQAGVGAVPMVCRSPVDLRGRMRPPLEATDVTNFAGVQMAQVEVRDCDDPVVIGKEIKEQIEAGIARDEPIRELTMRAPGETEEFSEAGLNIATVTNLGACPDFATAPDVDLVDFEVYTYSSVFSHPGYVAYTYRGRLKFQLIYRKETNSESVIDEIAGQLKDRLTWFSA